MSTAQTQDPLAQLPAQSRRSRGDTMAGGKRLRQICSHRSFAGWNPSARRRHPVELLKENSRGRLEDLVPLRYGRLMASPFVFYRGAAAKHSKPRLSGLRSQPLFPLANPARRSSACRTNPPGGSSKAFAASQRCPRQAYDCRGRRRSPNRLVQQLRLCFWRFDGLCDSRGPALGGSGDGDLCGVGKQHGRAQRIWLAHAAMPGTLPRGKDRSARGRAPNRERQRLGWALASG